MATAKKNLYLTSEVDIPTGEKHDKGDPKPVKRVGPGILSELDITNEEIASLPRGVVRAATADEIEAAEQRASIAETTELQREHKLELDELKAKQAAELEGKSPEQQAKLSTKHSEQLAALQEKQAKELGA